jgi:hypothetical protein
MTTDNFCFYLQNRLIQTSQTGGQWYSDTSPFSIPWPNPMELFSDHFLSWLCLPGVNFTNILQAAFSYEGFLRSFYVLTI